MKELSFFDASGAERVAEAGVGAYLELGMELFLFDCDKEMLSQRYQKDQWKEKQRVHIFLTHEPAREEKELADVLDYLSAKVYQGEPSRINVYYPEEMICRILTLQGISEKCYNFYVNKWDEFEVDGVEGQVEYMFHEIGERYAVEFAIPKDTSILYGAKGADKEQLCNLPAFDLMY